MVAKAKQPRATAEAKAKGPAASAELQMVPTEGRAAQEIHAKMSALQHQLAIAGPRAGFVTSRTKSGESLGSLGHYSRDWNLADAEVTSELRLAESTLHPAAPGLLKRKILAARHALDEVNKTADVSTSTEPTLFPSSHIYIFPQSPRFGFSEHH